jgi:membrane associated rhomboid family serine protease
MTPAVKALVYTNVGVFVFSYFFDPLVTLFGLSPEAVVTKGWVWQLFTYLFLHDTHGFMHILFNMLSLWMFGVDLERRWGTAAFTKYYFVTGVGAGAATLLVSLLPFASTQAIYHSYTIGASGAIYGLLLAWAVLFPHRTILFMLFFPLPARTAAILMGGIAFFSAVGGQNSSVAEATHLAGMVVGWLYLRGPKNLQLQLKYRMTKWRMDRMRKKFNVHSGGKDDIGSRFH